MTHPQNMYTSYITQVAKIIFKNAYVDTYVHAVTTAEKKMPWIWKRVAKGTWEDFEGIKGRDKCGNYITVSKIKIKTKQKQTKTLATPNSR